MSNVFSSAEELTEISRILTGYLTLPFSGDSIPGALLENVVATVKNSKVLNTYDFVDVVNLANKVGWQIKSTKASTPVTWKRAKLPDSAKLIAASQGSDEALQKLGNAIIRFCNQHGRDSLRTYGLKEIGYSRLVIHDSNHLTYFEKVLCSESKPDVFNEEDFEWRWSIPKKTSKKEQLPALHGTHKADNQKWFAWHGLGENQLHFSGEKNWWPTNNKNQISFTRPDRRLTQHEFMKLLSQISRVG